MKRCAIAAAVLLAASLTACGGAGDTANNADNTPATSTATSTSTSTTPPADPSTTAPSTPESSSDSGGGDDSAYCAELRATKSQFDNLNITGLNDAAFTKLTEKFDSLANAAPSAVHDDWQTLSAALTRVKQILASAGLSFDDLKTLTSGNKPPGVTLKQLEKVGRQLTAFSKDSSFTKAANEISAHAKAECGINLGN
jgi:hypothetical protein